MRRNHRHRAEDRAARLAEAEGASGTLDEQDEKVNRQLSLVDKLLKGWRRVHETNHLAQLFHDEGQL